MKCSFTSFTLNSVSRSYCKIFIGDKVPLVRIIDRGFSSAFNNCLNTYEGFRQWTPKCVMCCSDFGWFLKLLFLLVRINILKSFTFLFGNVSSKAFIFFIFVNISITCDSFYFSDPGALSVEWADLFGTSPLPDLVSKQSLPAKMSLFNSSSIMSQSNLRYRNYVFPSFYTYTAS